MSLLLSVLSIYFFILLGYLVKRKLKNEIQEKSLVIVSIYFLQPMLTVWGLTTRKMDFTILQAPLVYATVSIISIVISFFIAKHFFKDSKERSIITISSVLGNTGNLGIPLGIALFGADSIIYTTIINVTNIFIIYTFGVYFYSRGEFSPKESIKNIFKLPLIWFAILAVICNLSNIQMPQAIADALKMGAYASIVIQLMIFGMFLYSVKLKTINIKLLLHVILIKFIIIPVIAIGILYYINFNGFIVSIIMLELLVPLAVTNVNLSSLYDCKPIDVTALVFVTSLLFIPYIIFVMAIWERI